MWEDPVVAEVHRTHEKLAEEYNFDIGAFFADIRKRQVALGERLVRLKKRPEATAEPDADRRSDLLVPATIDSASGNAHPLP